jgi:transposase-like protein
MPTTSKKRGRKPDASSKSGKIRELLKTGMSAGDIAKKLGCTPALVYNVRARLGGAKKRSPGRKPAAATSQLDGLAGLLDAVKAAEQERASLRNALVRMQQIVSEALEA